MGDEKKYPPNTIAFGVYIFPDFSLICKLCIVHGFFFFGLFTFLKDYCCESAVGVRSDKRDGTDRPAIKSQLVTNERVPTNWLWRTVIFHALPPTSRLTLSTGNFLAILVDSVSGNYFPNSKQHTYGYLFL